ncbi:MAG: hypothetical protein ACOC2Y_03750 [Spirochaetota bacterium]
MPGMVQDDRRPHNELPVKISLTNEAVARFRANKKRLQHLRMADDTDSYGFCGTRFEPELLDRLIGSRILSGIETTGTDLFSKRHEILDLTGAVVRTILYDKFSRAFQALVYGSAAVKHWNRHNPHSVIDENTRIGEKQASGFLARHSREFQRLSLAILRPVLRALETDLRLGTDDRNEKIQLSRTFLRRVNPAVWYVVIALCTGTAEDEVLSGARSLLRRYLQKSSIVDYIGLIIVELVGYLQNTMLLRHARSHKPDVTFDTLIREPALLDQVRNEVAVGEEQQAISWRLAPSGGSFDKRVRLVISVYSRGEEYAVTKERVNEHKKTTSKESSLKKFLSSTADGTIDSDLGLYYLTDLTRSCNELGVLFDSSVVEVGRDRRSSITLTFHF